MTEKEDPIPEDEDLGPGNTEKENEPDPNNVKEQENDTNLPNPVDLPDPSNGNLASGFTRLLEIIKKNLLLTGAILAAVVGIIGYGETIYLKIFPPSMEFSSSMQDRLDNVTDETIVQVLEFIEPSGNNCIDPILGKLMLLFVDEHERIIDKMISKLVDSDKIDKDKVLERTLEKFIPFYQREMNKDSTMEIEVHAIVTYLRLLGEIGKKIDKSNTKELLEDLTVQVNGSIINRDDKTTILGQLTTIKEKLN